MALKITMLNMFAQILCEVMFVLNDSMIHIDRINRAVWSIEKIDWTETLIGRSQKLPLPHKMLTCQQAIFATDMNHANEIGGWLTEERCILKLRRKLITTIGHWTSSPSRSSKIALVINGAFSTTVHTRSDSRWIEFIPI